MCYVVGFADSWCVVCLDPYLAVWAKKMPRASPARMAERLRFGLKKDGGAVERKPAVFFAGTLIQPKKHRVGPMVSSIAAAYCIGVPPFESNAPAAHAA